MLTGAAVLGSAVGLGTGGTAMAAPAGSSAGAESAPIDPVKVTPDDPRYADLTLRGGNPQLRGKPDYYRLVGTTEQVVQAVQEAVRANQKIAVRSGGHCFEDFVDNAAVKVVIDMSQLADIYFDRERNAFAVEPGARLMEVFQKLYLGWNVTIPGGNCGGVGVGGHLCGGGYGPLSRQYGSVVDYLEAVEVVVVDKRGRARAVVATRNPSDPHHDLWWAHTGGGGGNFGVVTRYWLRAPGARGSNPSALLPKPPAKILNGVAIWSWNGMTKESFSRLLRNHGSWFERNSAPDSPYAKLWSVLLLGSPQVGAADPGGSLLVTEIDATVPNAAKLLADYHAAIGEGVEPKPTIVPSTELPWLQSAIQLNGGQVPGESETGSSKVKAAYLRKRFTDEQISLTYDYLAGDKRGDAGGGLWFVAYGGKVNTVAPDATAMPQRDSILKAIFLTGWENPADQPKHMKWIREWYRDTYAETGGVPVPGDNVDGSYINYPDKDLADPEWNKSGVPWSTLYYKDNYPRLQRVKAKYDPRDVFNHALSVRPV
ncbi:FAD-binding oxidoreductase [Flindersiella endophytica]